MMAQHVGHTHEDIHQMFEECMRNRIRGEEIDLRRIFEEDENNDLPALEPIIKNTFNSGDSIASLIASKSDDEDDELPELIENAVNNQDNITPLIVSEYDENEADDKSDECSLRSWPSEFKHSTEWKDRLRDYYYYFKQCNTYIN
jgi:hypothetical protein